MTYTDVLNRNRIMSLATVGGDGKPWCVPVIYALHDNALYWKSSAGSVHSLNLTQNKSVSIAIFDDEAWAPGGEREAFYLQSVAEIVPSEEREAIMTAIGDKFSYKDETAPLYRARIGIADTNKSTDSRLYYTYSDKNGDAA